MPQDEQSDKVMSCLGVGKMFLAGQKGLENAVDVFSGGTGSLDAIQHDLQLFSPLFQKGVALNPEEHILCGTFQRGPEVAALLTLDFVLQASVASDSPQDGFFQVGVVQVTVQTLPQRGQGGIQSIEKS